MNVTTLAWELPGVDDDDVDRGPKKGANQQALKRHEARRRQIRNWLLFLLLAGPNLVLIATFVYYQLVMNVRYSMLDWRLGSTTAKDVGFRNYVEFLSSPKGVEVWRVAAIFTLATVVATIILGILMALVLNQMIPGRTAVRTAVFAPYILSGVGIGMVWNFIFDPRIGLLSHVLAWWGKTSPEWFLNPTLFLIMVTIVYTWKNLGFAAVVVLSGLQSIPKDLLDAAAIDGAGRVRRFFAVVLPLLSPALFFLLIVSILNSMQAFDVLRIMTPSGNGTNTSIFEIYLQTFGPYQRAGYRAAISVILFLVLFLITAIQIRFVEKRVHYS